MDTELQLLKIAENFKTPVYVYYEDMIRNNCREFYSSFKKKYEKTRILYAYKANTNLTICSVLLSEGVGADVVSPGELHSAIKTGVDPGDIIFTNNSKSVDDLVTAVNSGVIINIDSVSELNTLNGILTDMENKNYNEISRKESNNKENSNEENRKEETCKNKKARISFRINPSVDPKTHPKISTGLRESKFGIHIENDLAFLAYSLAKTMQNMEIVGVHTHVGSQITDMRVFEDTAEKVMEFVYRLKKELDITLEFVDIGGGLGIPYAPQENGGKIVTPEDMANAIVPVIKEWNAKTGYEPELWLEPGRYLIGTAGVLLCRVQSVKETPHKKFVNVDAGFNTLQRPAMYDAYHKVIVVNKAAIRNANQEPGNTDTYDIVGNICESGDILAKDRRLPKIETGDTIAILDAGAYGFSMASRYNSRPLPAEVLIRGDSVELIRERESYEDLFLHQKVIEMI